MTFPESKVAHEWIDPIEAIEGRGVEFGPAAHNPFGFKRCIHADIKPPPNNSSYYTEQMRLAGWVVGTNVTAELGKPLPFKTAEFDYIVTSHVLEHVWDLIAGFHEMRRVLRPYGLMVHVLPHVDRTFDKGRSLTAWDELQKRHTHPENNPSTDEHHSVFNTELFLEIISNIPYLTVLQVLDVDDKVGNGFLVVLQLKHTTDEIELLKGQGPFPGEIFLAENQAFQHALIALQARNVKDAEHLFKAVLRTQPRHFGALNLLSIVLTRFGRLAEAETYLRLALDENPNSDATLHNYGTVLKALDRPTEALERFTQALAINSGAAETWNNRGAILSHFKRDDEAIGDFEKAIRLNPRYTEAFCNKGKSLAILKRHEEAFFAFDRALALNPNSAEAWLGRGNVLYDLKRFDEAAFAYERALALKPDFAEAKLGRSNVFAELKRRETALSTNRQRGSNWPA